MTQRFGKSIALFVCVLFLSAATQLFAQGRRAPQPENSRAAAGGQRIAPPSALKCSRDHLTSFTGKVIAYRRSPTRVFLRVRTDEETTESFSLKLTKAEDATKFFLLRGDAFNSNDWALIESSTGKLRQSTGAMGTMRATVWVCDDRSNPVISWQPPEK